jgi:hypothetical protein
MNRGLCRGDESSDLAGDSLPDTSALIILENPPSRGMIPPNTTMIPVAASGGVDAAASRCGRCGVRTW